MRFFAELGVPDPTPERELWTKNMLPTTGFLEHGGALVGYGYWELQPPLGYVRHVVVAPEARGRGLGATLMAALKRELSRGDCTRWCLNVKASNISARRLYQNVGMTDRYHSSVLRLAWARVSELPAAASVVARISPVSEDASVERRFGLPPGTLEIRRRRPEILVCVATNATEPEHQGGLAVFDPSFPGAYPFRADSALTARALLDLLASRRYPDQPEMQLVIEDDAPLSAALVQAGALQLFDVVHMEGAIE